MNKLSEIKVILRRSLKYNINNFILKPSALIVIAYYFGYINSITHKVIDYYYLPIGMLFVFLNVIFDIYFANNLNRDGQLYIYRGLEKEVKIFLLIFGDQKIDNYTILAIEKDVEINFINEKDLEESIGYYHDFYGHYERLNILSDLIEDDTHSELINKLSDLNIKMNEALKEKYNSISM